MRIAALLCVSVVSAAAQPQSSPDSPSRSLDRQGEAFMREGQYDDAQSAFAKALALEPNNARALLLSAQVNWLALGAQVPRAAPAGAGFARTAGRPLPSPVCSASLPPRKCSARRRSELNRIGRAHRTHARRRLLHRSSAPAPS